MDHPPSKPPPRDTTWRWELAGVVLQGLPPVISIPIWFLMWFGGLASGLFQMSPSRLARIAGLLGIAALPLAVLLAAVLR